MGFEQGSGSGESRMARTALYARKTKRHNNGEAAIMSDADELESERHCTAFPGTPAGSDITSVGYYVVVHCTLMQKRRVWTPCSLPGILGPLASANGDRLFF
jgi:hypothetical protein